MRIGVNGTIPLVGQAYIPLNLSITGGGYTSQGEVLSTVGTVIGLESGPAATSSSCSSTCWERKKMRSSSLSVSADRTVRAGSY